MTVTAIIEAVPGDKVLVENYRSKYKPWEEGTISSTEIDVRQDGTTRVHYSVHLDRRTYTKRAPWGNVIKLYVGDDQIRKIV